MGEERHPLPRMEAQGNFFSGQVEAEILLAPAGMLWRHKDDTGETGGGEHRRHRGSFGGGMGHGGGHRDGAYGEGEDRAHVPVHPSNLPSLQLRLRLTNRGTAPMDIEVVDFDSELGNFAVQPAKITLPPNQPVEAEPMVSRLGVEAQEIPLTIRLRSGSQSEQQVLKLHLITPPKPGPAESSETTPPPAS